jgi:hypothetical protein
MIFLRHIPIPEIYITWVTVSSILAFPAIQRSHAMLEMIAFAEAGICLCIPVLHPLVYSKITRPAEALRLNFVLFWFEPENLTGITLTAPTVKPWHNFRMEKYIKRRVRNIY